MCVMTNQSKDNGGGREGKMYSPGGITIKLKSLK